jgi:NADH dehydrogenase
MLIRRICILGGTGFVGRSLANRLARDGYALRVLTRDRERNRSALILLPELELIEADVHDPAQLVRHFAGCEAAVNLVGILNERGRDGSGFRHAHVDLAAKVVEAARRAGVRRLLHMSALNADARSGPSHYLRSKGEAEDRVHAAADLRPTSFRPSVVFGPGDSFFNRFARLLRIAPGVFPLACAGARFAPVFVGDVAEAMTRALPDPGTYGRRLGLCGPRVLTLEQIVRYVAECIRVRRLIVPLPDLLSRVQAAICDFVPGKPFSTDNYLSATVDSVCERNDLEGLGIAPAPIEAIVPQYLGGHLVRARYDRFRSRARRDAGGSPA